MEKKSIGAFIAVLRKSGGMTQKDLAERLGVSDKTVSHWERDESAPDLTLIPVVAEVFGVTCDELLRGERTRDPSEELSGKTEKQVKNLLDRSRRKFKTRSMVSLGISFLGLLAAVGLGLSAGGAHVIFLIACVFYMSAAICESIFYSYALYAVSGEDFDGKELNDYKIYVVRLAGKIISVPVVMFAASLALVLLPSPNYYMDLGSWVVWCLIAVPTAVVACIFIVYLVNNALIKKGVYALVKNADIKRHKVNRLKVLCTAITAAVLLAMFAGQMVFDKNFGPEAFTAGTVFNNLDAFKTYTETGIEGYEEKDIYPAIDGSTVEYFDEYGNPFSKKQDLTDYIIDDSGNVICQYFRLNPDVGRVFYSGNGAGGVSVTNYTWEQWFAGKSIMNLINTAWVGSYFIAAGVGFLVYFKKRVKLG